MEIKQSVKRFWRFLNQDTWQSWLVSLILILIFIKFIFFPILSLATGSSLPLVVVESCSMYHEASFNSWWDSNSAWYQSKKIEKENFTSFGFTSGLNKGDIIIVWGHSNYKIGDITIFNSQTPNPIIHRIVSLNPIETKGDHNSGQLPIETNIQQEQIIGKAVAKIPIIGWLKLIFFEPLRPESERGFCK